MAHLLNVWPSIASRLRGEGRVLILFDYDGTLTPIVARPEDALLPNEARSRLKELAGHPRGIVGIVSGRSLSDLREKVALDGLIYAGNHGMEISGPRMQFEHPLAATARPLLQRISKALSGAVEGIPGAFVENKGLTLTVHYRNVAESRVREVEAAVADATTRYTSGGHLRLTEGKMVIEVRPNIPWDKGRAIREIRENYDDLPYPFYFGDDRTDEDGFAAVQEMGGIAVFVGQPRQGTVALHQLDSPEEVSDCLRLLLEELRRSR